MGYIELIALKPTLDVRYVLVQSTPSSQRQGFVVVVAVSQFLPFTGATFCNYGYMSQMSANLGQC